MSPREFQNLAVKLLETPNPAECRTAINRAYYAVYNRGIEILARNEIWLPHDRSTHRDLRECFKRSGDQRLGSIGTQLQNLYRARERADYYLDDLGAEGRNVATQWTAAAGRLLDKFDEFEALHVTAREPAIRGIKRYLGRA